jgi:hypothetical protein
VATIILRVPSSPFAEHVLFKNAKLNDYFPCSNVKPSPSKLSFSEKSMCAPLLF